MQPWAEAFFTELETLHAALAAAVADLPPEALDWSPGPEVNSLAVLAMHVAGAEQYWLGDVVAQTPTDRDRPAEFATHAVDAEVLTTRLAEATVFARHVLEALGPDEVNALRVVPRNGEQHTVAYCVTHIVAHTAQHLGHVEATRAWWLATQG